MTGALWFLSGALAGFVGAVSFGLWRKKRMEADADPNEVELAMAKYILGGLDDGDLAVYTTDVGVVAAGTGPAADALQRWTECPVDPASFMTALQASDEVH